MVKISSEILLRDVLLAASKMQQLGYLQLALPRSHLQFGLFVPLPFPGPGSAPGL